MGFNVFGLPLTSRPPAEHSNQCAVDQLVFYRRGFDRFAVLVAILGLVGWIVWMLIESAGLERLEPAALGMSFLSPFGFIYCVVAVIRSRSIRVFAGLLCGLIGTFMWVMAIWACAMGSGPIYRLFYEYYPESMQ